MILKIAEKDKLAPKPYIYKIKRQNAEKTAKNTNYAIENMSENNEDGLVFIGKHFFALPHFDGWSQ